ncbi:MAG: transcription termination/antitermination protein NusA, partial [Sphingomonadales bacterium]
EDAPKRPEPKGGILSEYGLSDEQGNEIIMAARAHWFEDEAPATTSAADAANSEDAVAESEQ